MPLYIGDYLADTMQLSTVEHGAYLLLLMAYWKNRGPVDEKAIPVICRMSLSEFSAIRSAIEPFFQVENGNLWRNKRADAEIDRWQGFKDQKEYGAALSNLKRHGTPIPEKFAERYAERSLSVTPPPLPLPPSDKTHGDKRLVSPILGKEPKFQEPRLQEAWDGWIEMRKKIRKPPTKRAEDMAVKKLRQLTNGDIELAIKILDKSTLNNWQDVFSLREEEKKEKVFK